jgi:hypothetical protein
MKDESVDSAPSRFDLSRTVVDVGVRIEGDCHLSDVFGTSCTSMGDLTLVGEILSFSIETM